MRKLFVYTFLVITILGCSQQNQTNQQIENLRTFAKIYGYVKYFHPSDEAAALDWDLFAIYGARQVGSAQNREELVTILNTLFLPIAPSMIIHEAGQEVTFDLEGITPKDTTGFKTIAWQHCGVGLSENSVYKSARINRKVEHKPDPNTWGSLVNQFDAIPYRGMEFELEAYVKTSIKSIKGGVHLWLRVDLENGDSGFFENLGDTPINTPEWKKYKFSGRIDDDAHLLNIGMFMRGMGEIWVDEYILKIKEEDEWRTLKSYDFETYENGDFTKIWKSGIGMNTSGQSKTHTFSIASDEAFKGNYSMKATADDSSTFSSPIQLFEKYPNHGEFMHKEVGNNLQVMIPISLLGNDDHTYPKSNASDLERLVLTIERVVSNPLIGKDLEVRWADLIISWNIFQHFFPYFDVVDTDWDAALTEALKISYEDENEIDFLKTLKKFTSKLQDGHVDVFLDGDTTTQYVLPFEWEWIENRLLITNVLSDEINLNVGDIVLEIDELSSSIFFDNARQYISSPSETWMENKVSRHTLRGKKGTSVQLKLMDSGEKIRMETIERSMTRDEHWDGNQRNEKSSFDELSPGLYYLNLDKISMAEINSLLPELEEAKGIICDLRGYPNGNHGLISHLLEENDTSKSWMRIPQVIYADYENLAGFDHHGFELKAKAPHIAAKVVFIINGRAISYSESYMGLIEHYNLATIVGESTAGTNGNINPFNLPGGYRIWWTGMKVVKHDGSLQHGVGIIPDVPVFRTIQGVRESRDEYLEKAIEIVEQE